MKKFLLVVALISFVSWGTEAQQQRRSRESASPEKVAERITEQMSKELTLSEEQKKEVYALHLENTQKRREERRLMRERLKAQEEASQEKLDAILTPEQKEKWEARKKEFRDERRSPRDGRGKSERRDRKHRRPSRHHP